MLASAWLFVGAVAFLWTVVAVTGGVVAGAQAGRGDGIATVGGVVGFVLWGVWTFGALNVEVVTDSGSTVTMTHPELAIVGVMMALVPGYIALTGPIELVSRYRDASPEDL